MGTRGRAMVTSLVPKLRLEMTATQSDTATLAWLAESPPPTTILIGEKTLLAPRAVARLLGAALEATTVMVPGAAHMIPITHPEAVVTPFGAKWFHKPKRRRTTIRDLRARTIERARSRSQCRTNGRRGATMIARGKAELLEALPVPVA